MDKSTLVMVVLYDATECLEMFNSIERIFNSNGVVTVSDVKTLSGATSTFIDERWGWKNLNSIEYTGSVNNQGWIFLMPTPIPL